jgi:hypothetical protein
LRDQLRKQLRMKVLMMRLNKRKNRTRRSLLNRYLQLRDLMSLSLSTILRTVDSGALNLFLRISLILKPFYSVRPMPNQLEVKVRMHQQKEIKSRLSWKKETLSLMINPLTTS